MQPCQGPRQGNRATGCINSMTLSRVRTDDAGDHCQEVHAPGDNDDDHPDDLVALVVKLRGCRTRRAICRNEQTFRTCRYAPSWLQLSHNARGSPSGHRAFSARLDERAERVARQEERQCHVKREYPRPRHAGHVHVPCAERAVAHAWHERQAWPGAAGPLSLGTPAPSRSPHPMQPRRGPAAHLGAGPVAAERRCACPRVHPRTVRCLGAGASGRADPPSAYPNLTCAVDTLSLMPASCQPNSQALPPGRPARHLVGCGMRGLGVAIVGRDCPDVPGRSSPQVEYSRGGRCGVACRDGGRPDSSLALRPARRGRCKRDVRNITSLARPCAAERRA